MRVTLEPGEQKEVHVAFDTHTFAYFDVVSNDWAKLGGEYVVELGASIKDIRLEGTVQIAESKVSVAYDQEQLSAYFSGRVQNISAAEFEALLGQELPPALWDRSAPLTYDDTIAQLRYGGVLGRTFLGLLQGARRLLFAIGKPYAANNVMFIMNLPFSKIPAFTGGKISERFIKKRLGINK